MQCPGISYVGEGALAAALPELGRLGMNALIVAGGSAIHSRTAARLQTKLRAESTRSVVFAGVSSEPTDAMIAAGAAAYRAQNCDCLIGLGGGSQLDAAKAIGVAVTGEGTLADWAASPVTRPLPPLALIPTTAGSGSEATQVAVITDTAAAVKRVVRGPTLVPAIAVVDPSLTVSLPPAPTAYTGLDALTHAVESYTSRRAFAETDMYALAAVPKIFANLPRAYRDGSDHAARTEMARAAHWAGLSFGNASVTLVHGMSRPLGAVFGLPHGLANALLLPECLEFAVDGATERFATLGRAVGAATAADDDERAARQFVTAVKALCLACGTPTLAACGVERDTYFAAIDKMARDAMASGSPANTRRNVSAADLKDLYARSW